MAETTDMRWLRWSLTAIALLLGVIALQLSALIGPLGSQAHAQIPDSGLQRKQLLDAQYETNAKLDRILQHLRTETIKVRLVSTDKDTKRTTPVSPRATEPEKK